MELNFTPNEVYSTFINHIVGKNFLKIEDAVFNISYNFHDHENNNLVIVKDEFPIIQIRNSEEFKNALYNYVKTYFEYECVYTRPEDRDDIYFNEANKMQYALLDLFINATFNDFENPIPYMYKRAEFIKNNFSKTFKEWTQVGEFANVPGSKIMFRIKGDSYAYETPERLEVKVVRENENGKIEEFDLPAVRFGIAGNTATVYTIQNLVHSIRDEELAKKINKVRFKLNKGVDEEDLDVEPYNLISASVFAGFAKGLGAKRINVVNILPTRYFAKESAIYKKANGDVVKIEELSDDQLRIQTTLTDRFTKTFLRLGEQTGQIQLYSDVNPSEVIFSNTPTQAQTPNEFLETLYHTTSHQAQNKVQDKSM